MRIGSGYDVHKLVEGRDFIIGGVTIPYEKGLLGHSDAAYKGVSSLVLLQRVKELLEENFYLIENIDATIIAQKPKMAPYIPAMRENIARVLGIQLNQINIKATTEEGLGFTGEGLGIACNSICLLTSAADYRYDDRSYEYQGASNGCAGCSGCALKNK
jgi:2-C-methyl-D-erythritol 2,4-cyclodiphosphate synthase